MTTISKDFVLAGHAIFTVSNPKGEHYTYKVTHKEASGKWPEAFFVATLTGPCNTEDYTYLGMLSKDTGAVRLTKNSTYKEDSLPVQVVRWALKQVWTSKPIPEGYKVHHEGYCGRCGKMLTVSASVEDGFGPECIKKIRGMAA